MTKKTKIKAQKKAKEDANLDEALAETFPASDPPSMTQPRTGRTCHREDRGDIRREKCRPGRSQIISNEVVGGNVREPSRALGRSRGNDNVDEQTDRHGHAQDNIEYHG